MVRPGHVRRIGMLLAMLVLAACGSVRSPNFSPGPDPIVFAIRFAPATSYDAALRMVTDLGLQPGFYCGTGTTWQPMGQRASFGTQHIFVVFSYGAPADWLTPLEAVPGIVSVVHALPSYPDWPTPAISPSPTATVSPFEPAGSPTAAPYVYACPGVLPPAARTPIIPNADPAGVYARVSFISPLATYASALAVAVNLGLPLANPCRDAADEQGTPLPWQSPGQEVAFARTHTLVVVTAWDLTSDQWQRQLAQVPGVSTVQTPYAPACS